MRLTFPCGRRVPSSRLSTRSRGFTTVPSKCKVMSRSSAYPLSFFAALIFSLLSLVSPAALAQNATHISSQPTLSGGFKFAEQSGEELYANVCQGCHMPDGKGANRRRGISLGRTQQGRRAQQIFAPCGCQRAESDAAVRRHDERRSDRRCRELCAHALRQRL